VPQSAYILGYRVAKKLLGLFYYSINPEGIIVLGSAETLGVQAIFLHRRCQIEDFQTLCYYPDT